MARYLVIYLDKIGCYIIQATQLEIKEKCSDCHVYEVPEGSFLQIDSKHTFLETSFLCVFMRRNDKLKSKAHVEFSVIYNYIPTYSM